MITHKAGLRIMLLVGFSTYLETLHRAIQCTWSMSNLTTFRVMDGLDRWLTVHGFFLDEQKRTRILTWLSALPVSPQQQQLVTKVSDAETAQDFHLPFPGQIQTRRTKTKGPSRFATLRMDNSVFLDPTKLPAVPQVPQQHQPEQPTVVPTPEPEATVERLAPVESMAPVPFKKFTTDAKKKTAVVETISAKKFRAMLYNENGNTWQVFVLKCLRC